MNIPVGLTFGQHLASTFLAVVAGFIFSIFLFYLQSGLAVKIGKKRLEKNLRKEFDYNIKYLNSIKIALQDMIDQINSGRPITPTQPRLQLTLYGRIFLMAYVQQGYIYDKLAPKEMKSLDAVLRTMSVEGENAINNMISTFVSDGSGKEILLNTLTAYRVIIEQNIAFNKTMRAKI